MSASLKVTRPNPAQPLPTRNQLRMMFDTAELQRMSPAQRAKALTSLATLLMLAASGVTKGHDDDER